MLMSDPWSDVRRSLPLVPVARLAGRDSLGWQSFLENLLAFRRQKRVSCGRRTHLLLREIVSQFGDLLVRQVTAEPPHIFEARGIAATRLAKPVELSRDVSLLLCREVRKVRRDGIAVKAVTVRTDLLRQRFAGDLGIRQVARPLEVRTPGAERSDGHCKRQCESLHDGLRVSDGRDQYAAQTYMNKVLLSLALRPNPS
jgi:hypothetical protein